MNPLTEPVNGTHRPVRKEVEAGDMASNKAAYRTLCALDDSVPIFSTDWWLDAVVGPDGWDVALATANGRIIGAMPFATTRQFGLTVVRQPPLTPYLGPWLRTGGEKLSTRLGNEQKVMQTLIGQIPRFDLFRQTCGKDLLNWLPFNWKGFTQTTEYTYVLHGLDNLDDVWSGFDSDRRSHCKRGADGFALRDDLPVDAFLVLHKMTLANRGVHQSFSDACLQRVDAACAARNRRRIQIVVDDAGRPCAGTYTVWDRHCAYALMKGSDPAIKNPSVPSFCQWEAIKFSATVADRYDFLGNMNPSIEPYVRSFGTRQTPVFTVSKTPSRLLRLHHGLRAMLPDGR